MFVINEGFIFWYNVVLWLYIVLMDKLNFFEFILIESKVRIKIFFI